MFLFVCGFVSSPCVPQCRWWVGGSRLMVVFHRLFWVFLYAGLYVFVCNCVHICVCVFTVCSPMRMVGGWIPAGGGVPSSFCAQSPKTDCGRKAFSQYCRQRAKRPTKAEGIKILTELGGGTAPKALIFDERPNISPPLLSPGIEKFCPKFSVKYLFLSFLPPAIRWVPMIHRKLGLVIKAEISIPLLKIMRSTDVPGIQIFSPNQGYCQAAKEKGY